MAAASCEVAGTIAVDIWGDALLLSRMGTRPLCVNQEGVGRRDRLSVDWGRGEVLRSGQLGDVGRPLSPWGERGKGGAAGVRGDGSPNVR